MLKPSSIVKYILGIFLFGLVLWANPVEGFAFYDSGRTAPIPNNTVLPYEYNNFWPSEFGISPTSYTRYPSYTIPFDNLPFSPDYRNACNFTLNISLNFYNTLYNVDCNGEILAEITIYYYDHSNTLVSLPVFSQFQSISFTDNCSYPSINFSFPVHLDGAPAYYILNLSTAYFRSSSAYRPWIFSSAPSFTGHASATSSGSSSQTMTISGYTVADPNASTAFYGSAYGSEYTSIYGYESGYESGTNGNQSYNGSWSGSTSVSGSGSWATSPNGLFGTIDVGRQNIIATGTFTSTNSDYDFTWSEDDIDPSGSYFVFAFWSLVTDFQYDFDGNINANTSSIKTYSSSIDSNTSTLVDQFEDFFDYVAPNTQSFNADKSTTDSMIQSASSIQTGYFDSLTSAVVDTGLDSYDFAEYNPQVNYVSGLLTDVYDTFPNKVKYVIYFVLFLGMFSVLINAVAYVVKKG